MNDTVPEGGEPAIFRFVWGSVYVCSLVLFLGLLAFLVGNWKSLPIAIRLITALPIIAFVAALWFCARCFVGKDAFLFDHPIICHTFENGVRINGVFSKLDLTPNMVRNVRRFAGWTVVEVSVGGKARYLWFAPWFRNREQIVKSIRGG